MPGLCGFVSEASSNAVTDLKQVMQGMSHHVDHQNGSIYHDAFMAATMVSPRIGSPGGTWQGPDGVQVWIDGEAFDEQGPKPLEELAALLCSDTFPRCDGSFVAVIYHPFLRKLRFITDPYGLKYLYVRVTDGLPAWSGELAAFTQMPGPAYKINRTCLDQILEYGYPIGDITWFQGVHLLEPGACWEYHGGTGQWSHRRYTQVENQIPDLTTPDWNATVAELGGKFRRAVQKRSVGGGRIGLTLSGGLDSRAILAALPAPRQDVQTLTFGIPGCADAKLAKRVCAIGNETNHFSPLGGEGWLQARYQDVPLTDGQFNILHMHGMESLSQIETLMDTCMNGFLGDALWGGSYLSGTGFPFLTRYLHRGRRFILQALHHHGTSITFQLPFMDLPLLDHVLRLPRAWLANAKIYRAVLLREFPEYFAAIPWEKTGLPISASPLREKVSREMRRIMHKGRRMLGYRNPGYTDYAHWLRQGSAPDFLNSQLGSNQSLLKSYIPSSKIDEVLNRHQQGDDVSELLGRQLTVEAWLRYLKNARL